MNGLIRVTPKAVRTYVHHDRKPVCIAQTMFFMHLEVHTATCFVQPSKAVIDLCIVLSITRYLKPIRTVKKYLG
jgi:hypothetical protein